MTRIKDYFKESAECLARAAIMFFKGTFYGVRRLFAFYPNPTWAVIAAGITVAAVVQVGKARSERDSYNQKNAELQQQLDSVMNKQTRYAQWR